MRSKDNPLLVQETGLDFWTSRYLLYRFGSTYEKYSFYSEDGQIKEVNKDTGHPRSLNAGAVLWLIIMWTRTKVTNLSLSLIFGITLPRVNLWRRFALCVLLSVFKRDQSPNIKTPTTEECKLYFCIICNQYAIIGKK